MVCMAVKTTLLVEIVIERNLPENWSSVSLLNIIAPPYLQDAVVIFILTRQEDAVTCGIPLSSVCTRPQGCSRGEPAVGEAWTGGG